MIRTIGELINILMMLQKRTGPDKLIDIGIIHEDGINYLDIVNLDATEPEVVSIMVKLEVRDELNEFI